MAKIVELEKQLMQRNKELDVIRVSAIGRLWLMPRLSGGICCAFLVWEVMTVVMGWAISVSFLIWNLEQISSRFICLCSQRWTFNALSVPAKDKHILLHRSVALLVEFCTCGWLRRGVWGGTGVFETWVAQHQAQHQAQPAFCAQSRLFDQEGRRLMGQYLLINNQQPARHQIPRVKIEVEHICA